MKKQLEKFYDLEAKKYYFTRKKHRADGEIILNEIKKYWKKNISILEFGCGSGRLISFLNQNLKWKNINYIWVDLSKNLIKYAKKDNPNNIFVHDDISNYIKEIKQESLDFIIWVASFQHIPTKKERIFLMKNFYKALKYDGKIIVSNRSLSKRFIKKHYKTLIKSFLKFVYTLWLHNPKDLQIPWKNKDETYYRYYHMFSKTEIERIAETWWFKTKLSKYTDRNWEVIDSRQNSQNTIYIWEKNV